MSHETIKFQLNGETVEVSDPPMARLLDVLRESMRLTGTKEGCGEENAVHAQCL